MCRLPVFEGALKTWIDEHWDHAFLAGEGDLVLVEALRAVPETRLYLFLRVPSTEALARELFGVAPGVRRYCGSGCGCESPAQYAEYVPDLIPLGAPPTRPAGVRWRTVC